MHYGRPLFSYELKTPGLAQATFTFEDATFCCELTNACNPLGDLLSGMVAIISNPIQLWGETNSRVVEWYGEGFCYKWTLTLLTNQLLQIEIKKTELFFDEEEEIPVLDIKCKFEEFAFSIVSELDTFIKRVGLLNYSQNWQSGEFPITYFLYLKKILIDNGHWTKQNRQQSDTLSDELLLLLA